MISLISCNEKKSYEEYDENEFYEVQGIITSEKRTSYPFDEYYVKDIKFDYFINGEKLLHGYENNLDFINLSKGLPIIVLVHKQNEKISFFGRAGVIDNLTETERNYFKPIIEKEIEKMNRLRK
ncbi:hypothetical protein [Lutibacter oceani]|uniref:hypothetical protein n=1 Tax=Lutibacter oceani TaxID=1853311 RepID=UPI0011C061E9|nr:hypothetical protein [Lutibacter oceani]